MRVVLMPLQTLTGFGTPSQGAMVGQGGGPGESPIVVIAREPVTPTMSRKRTNAESSGLPGIPAGLRGPLPPGMP